MEISEEIYKSLLNLKEKKSLLESEINEKTESINKYKEDIISLNSNIEILDSDVNKKTKILEDLNSTISETEKGYNKIIDAGETLMAILNQNIDNINL